MRSFYFWRSVCHRRCISSPASFYYGPYIHRWCYSTFMKARYHPRTTKNLSLLLANRKTMSWWSVRFHRSSLVIRSSIYAHRQTFSLTSSVSSPKDAYSATSVPSWCGSESCVQYSTFFYLLRVHGLRYFCLSHDFFYGYSW